MARERGTVACVVRSVVNGFDVRETGEVHQAGAEDRRKNRSAQALGQGSGAAGGIAVAGAADNRHGASLCSISGE